MVQHIWARVDVFWVSSGQRSATETYHGGGLPETGPDVGAGLAVGKLIHT
jgi:hypothetical protein